MPVARVAQANAAAARCVQDGRVHYCGLNPMPTYKAPLRDVRFLMNEVFDYPAHYAALSNGKDADPDTVSALLAECAKFFETGLATVTFYAATDGEWRKSGVEGER